MDNLLGLLCPFLPQSSQSSAQSTGDETDFIKPDERSGRAGPALRLEIPHEKQVIITLRHRKDLNDIS